MISNLAIVAHTERSVTDTGIFLPQNGDGTFTIFDTYKEYGIKRYYQASTDEVYDDILKTTI